tara:strand:+ start:2364 stop:6044 length:3681 start_codon:yes stop_codon:yes gene_type:complete
MPQTDTTQQFFTDYGKYAYAEGFLGKSPNAESVETVVTRYKNNITEHSLQHYELFTNSFNKNTLTSHNLLYYHIYGDYRLVIDNERTAYRYVSPDLQSSQVFTSPTLSVLSDQYFLRDYLTVQRFDRVNGIYNDVGNDGQLVFEFGDVPWLTQELSREGTGTKFNLPSIGTQIVKLHSFGNASQLIKEAMINEMLEMVAFYERNYVSIPEYIKITDNTEVISLAGLRPAAGARPADELNENISDLFVIILSQMRNNPEYIELGGRTVNLNSDAVNNAIREIYTLSQDYDNGEAVSKFVNTIFGSATQKFDVGNPVQLTFNETNNKLQLIADQLTVATDAFQYQYDTFEINTFNPEQGGYIIVHVPTGTEIDIRNPNNLAERYFFKDNDLRAVAELNLDGDGDVQYTGGDTGNNNNRRQRRRSGSGGGGKKTLPPAMIVYQRIILDTFAAIQAVIHLSDWAGFGQMDASIDRVKAENKMRFLSKGVNVYSVTKQDEKKGKDKKRKINARTIYQTFPNIAHFSATRIEGIEPKKDAKTANFGLLDEMVKWRTYYTLSILSGIRKKSFDTQLLDSFHSSNMLVAEIKWLTSALAEGSKVLVKKKQDQDLLNQAQYRDIGQTPQRIQQFASAPLETVFYEVDVPLFKMVIAEYNDVYNKTVIARAFNVPKEVITTSSGGKSERPDIFRLLKDAKNARNRGDRDEQGRLLLQAMNEQPQAFIVDQPLGASGRGGGDYPGLTYKPTGNDFKFHTRPEFIPSDIEGASEIPDNAGNRPHPDLAPPTGASMEVSILSTKATKAPNEGDLAKLIWTSARDRIKGIFDIEGVKPHEFMDSLFNRIEQDLNRSNIMRSPFPDAWLGTDTVNKLRTDPMYLGMAPDRKYYTERLIEYVDALKSKYINNWRVPTTLVTMFENAMIKYTKDPDTLKNAFLERLEKDADRANLVTTNYIMRPYQITIAIMRNVLQVPLEDREMYTAEEIDDQMRRDIQDHLAGGEIKPILPETHPSYSEFEPRRITREEPDELIIPELGEIQPIVFTNPTYKHDVTISPAGVESGQRWYRTTETKNEGQYSVGITTGEKAQYKMHISIDPNDYDQGYSDDADLVAAFLIANKIHHKMGGPTYRQDSDINSPQYGKMFTIYAKTKQDFLNVMNGMKILCKRYNIQGIKPEDWRSTHNMRFEKVIRDTNNTLYYTVEKVNDRYLDSPYDKRIEYLLKFKGQGPLDEYVDWGRP